MEDGRLQSKTSTRIHELKNKSLLISICTFVLVCDFCERLYIHTSFGNLYQQQNILSLCWLISMLDLINNNKAFVLYILRTKNLLRQLLFTFGIREGSLLQSKPLDYLVVLWFLKEGLVHVPKKQLELSY